MGILIQKRKKINSRLVGLLALLAFFMAFNNILVNGLNLSIFIFLNLLIISIQKVKVFRIENVFHVLAVLFAISAIISCLDINNDTTDNGFDKALIVLPNYIYWCVLIIVLTNLSKVINFLEAKNLMKISKNIAIGTIATVVFYEFLSELGTSLINDNTPNSYAFMMVCFGAISVVYVNQNFAKHYSLIYFLVILTSLLLLERRAGFILVLFSGWMALNFHRIQSKRIVRNFMYLGIVYLCFQLGPVKNMFLNASPRIYETIYESENIKTQDQSYLTRVAQIEKAMILFENNPWTGIGLNNFGLVDVNLKGNFEGAELIIHKELSNKSAHNSYISVLAEGGLFLFIPLILILFFNLYYGVIFYNRRSQLENSYYWSFIAMIFHLYFISELYNVFSWFLIAIVSSISLKHMRIHKLAVTASKFGRVE